jgi:hypothetical protein
MYASSLQDLLISSEPYETREGKVGIKERNPPQKICGLAHIFFLYFTEMDKTSSDTINKMDTSIVFTDSNYKMEHGRFILFPKGFGSLSLSTLYDCNDEFSLKQRTKNFTLSSFVL